MGRYRITGQPAALSHDTGEPANIFTSGDPADAYWTEYKVTKTSGQTDSSGGTTATKITPNTETDAHNIQHYMTTVEAGTETYRYRTKVKAVGHSWINLSMDDDGFTSVCNCWVNLSTGTLGAWADNDAGLNFVGTPTVTSLGSGWYAVQYEFENTTGSLIYPRLIFGNAEWGNSFAGDGTSGVLCEEMYMGLIS